MFNIVIIKREIWQNRLGQNCTPTSSELTCSLKSLIRSDSTVTAAKAGSSSSLPLTFKIQQFTSLLKSGEMTDLASWKDFICAPESLCEEQA